MQPGQSTTTCPTCSAMLTFPSGTAAVQCPECQSVLQLEIEPSGSGSGAIGATQQLCPTCSTSVEFGSGDETAQCPACGTFLSRGVEDSGLNMGDGGYDGDHRLSIGDAGPGASGSQPLNHKPSILRSRSSKLLAWGDTNPKNNDDLLCLNCISVLICWGGAILGLLGVLFAVFADWFIERDSETTVKTCRILSKLCCVLSVIVGAVILGIFFSCGFGVLPYC